MSAGRLSEWGPRHAGLGNAIARSSWVTAFLQGAHVWGIREGRAFLGDQPYTSSLPRKAPQSLHFWRMLVGRSDSCHQPLTCCHAFLQEAFYGSLVLSQSSPNSMRSYQLSGSAFVFFSLSPILGQPTLAYLFFPRHASFCLALVSDLDPRSGHAQDSGSIFLTAGSNTAATSCTTCPSELPSR